MLIMKDVVKDYVTGDSSLRAMNKVSVSFRENEFVAILGPSGSGKTTMLNIIGGLDRYTSGDLVINGKSTKTFKDEDWDTYRNHSIGFIFQSYNLIPHQSVLANVELALTLSGVGKTERRERAIKALEQVGLGDYINKKPNQMSGGQVQRVAIARALINDPDILLADEPTGALDSETSIQIMDLLKEISKDKLIIMVTHNPELAHEYANRIIRFKDGRMIGDSNPYEPTEADYRMEKVRADEEKKKGRKPSMSLKTAFGLSLRNLMTKKARTILTAFAGSIGIIGIALVIALSTGIENYVGRMQSDALLAYPYSVEREAVNTDTIMNSFSSLMATGSVDHDKEHVYVNDLLTEMLNTFVSETDVNNVGAFRKFIMENQEQFDEICNDIQYRYTTPLNIYRADTDNGIIHVNPNTLLEDFQGVDLMSMMEGIMGTTILNAWYELIGDEEFIKQQYDVVYGRLPQAKNEVVLILDQNSEITEFVLYGLGLRDQGQFSNDLMSSLAGSDALNLDTTVYTYEEICSLKFKLVLPVELMQKDPVTGVWKDKSKDTEFVKKAIENGLEISIVGVLLPNDETVFSLGTNGLGYRTDLMDYALEMTENSEVVQEQLNNPAVDVLTGLKFNTLTVNDFDLKDIDFKDIDMTYLNLAPFMSLVENVDLSNINIADLSSTLGFGDMTELQKKLIEGYLDDDQVLALKQAYVDTMNAKCSYKKTMATLGYDGADNPTSIYFYPKDFECKAEVTKIINYYNEQVAADGHPEYQITPTDVVGSMLETILSVVNIVTYVLVVFIAISLIVSSVMIGIITYISVLERTKEIGILRSIGASKGDVSRVFNAEAITIGLGAGLLGIISTLLLEIPINILLKVLTSTGAAASLPGEAAAMLIGISVVLTFVAGLVPSSIAAKKDPVEALRTE